MIVPRVQTPQFSGLSLQSRVWTGFLSLIPILFLTYSFFGVVSIGFVALWWLTGVLFPQKFGRSFDRLSDLKDKFLNFVFILLLMAFYCFAVLFPGIVFYRKWRNRWRAGRFTTSDERITLRTQF